MAGIIVIIAIYLILNLSGGIYAGMQKEKRFFWFAVTGLITFAGIFLAGIKLNAAEIGKTISAVYIQLNPEAEFLIQDHVLSDNQQLRLAILIAINGITAGITAYCCRKNSARWHTAFLWSLANYILFNFLLFLPALQSAVFYLILSAKEQYPFIVPALTYSSILSVLFYFFILSLIWGIYTISSQHRSWKIITAAWGITAAFTLLIWISCLSIGAVCAEKVETTAAENKIFPLKNDSRLQKKFAGSKNFYSAYPLYSPPYNGVHNWFCPNSKLSVEEREFTLKFFNSPAVHAHLAKETEFALMLKKPHTLHQGSCNAFRSVVRSYCDRAALFEMQGQKDQILPELLRYPQLEKAIGPRSNFLIVELVRAACRSYWIKALCRHAPNDPQYADFYREILNFSKSWHLCLPDEAGYFINFDQPENNPVKSFFMKPAIQAIRYRGFFSALNIRKKLSGLEKQELFTGDLSPAVPINAAMRQRAIIVQGQVAAALKCFQAKNGHYPEKLIELIPEYLEKIPLSPTGEKLEYRLDNGEFILTIPASRPLTLSSGIQNHSS